MFSCRFAAYFQNTFSSEHLWRVASETWGRSDSTRLIKKNASEGLNRYVKDNLSLRTLLKTCLWTKKEKKITSKEREKTDREVGYTFSIVLLSLELLHAFHSNYHVIYLDWPRIVHWCRCTRKIFLLPIKKSKISTSRIRQEIIKMWKFS